MADAKKKAPAKKAAPKKDMSLEEQLVATRADLWAARKNHASGELVNPRVLARYRKDIARIMTKLNAKKEAK